MNTKLLVISGLVLMMLCTTITIPAVSKPDDAGIFGRTHTRAIGNFYFCEDDGNLYGHILIGFNNFKPVFNSDIEINKDSIKWIVMGGFSSNSETKTYFYLNCVFKE